MSTPTENPTGTTTRTVVVVGHGMVGHRFVEALRSRDTDRARGRSPCSARRPRRRTTASACRPTSEPGTARRTRPRGQRRMPATTSSTCGSAPGPSGSTARLAPSRRAPGTSSPTTRSSWRPAPTPSCRRSRATTRRAASSTARSTTSTASASPPSPRSSGRGGGARGERPRRRRWPARPRGGQRPAPARPRRRTSSSSPPGSCRCRSTRVAARC